MAAPESVKGVLVAGSPEPHGIGTPLAEYAESGPYCCKMCEYLKGGDKPYKDKNGKGRCNQEVMKRDSKVKHDRNGLSIVEIPTGCCRYVEPRKK